MHTASRVLVFAEGAVALALVCCGGGTATTTSSGPGGSGAGTSTGTGAGSSTSASTSAGASTTTTTSASASTGSGGSVTGPVACAPTCNPQMGACGPLLVCTADNSCPGLTAAAKPVTTEIDAPTCATTKSSTHPAFDDGAPLTWTDTNGDERYACVHAPAGASSSAKLPLVVFLHGSHGSARDLYDYTLLRAKSDTFQLSTDASRTGFIVAAVQGRNLHWLGPNPGGPHHDYFYRDLASPSENPDVRSLDHLIDALVAEGSVDPAQIYVTGWSNGAFFAQMYAMARLTTATPGGAHVAAAAVYAGADPFNTPEATLPCQLMPYPKSQAPIFLVHRSCDIIVACDPSQLGSFPPGNDVETWKATLTSAAGVGDSTVQDLILDDNGMPVTSCASSCGAVQGGLNHLHWPDGLDDEGGVDHEPEMLGFMRANPHP